MSDAENQFESAIVPESFVFSGAAVPLAGDRWTARDPRGTVVLLHGGGQTRHSWASTGSRLARAGWTSIALDLRGHGDSGWAPDGDYSLDAFVDDVVHFVTALDEPPVLVGASLGGITSLVVAGENVGLTRGLVMVDIVVELEMAGVDRIRSFMTDRPNGFTSLEEASDAIAAYNPHRPRPRNLDGLRKNLRQRDDGRWYWHWDPSFIQIDDEPRRRRDPEPLRAAARRIEVPTLLVRGLRSDVVSEAGIADMRELVPHSQVVDVGAAGHMVAGDDNDVFSVSLEEFLDEVARIAVRPQGPSSPAREPGCISRL